MKTDFNEKIYIANINMQYLVLVSTADIYMEWVASGCRNNVLLKI